MRTLSEVNEKHKDIQNDSKETENTQEHYVQKKLFQM